MKAAWPALTTCPGQRDPVQVEPDRLAGSCSASGYAVRSYAGHGAGEFFVARVEIHIGRHAPRNRQHEDASGHRRDAADPAMHMSLPDRTQYPIG